MCCCFFSYGNCKNIKNRRNISQETTENKLNIVNLHSYSHTAKRTPEQVPQGEMKEK